VHTEHTDIARLEKIKKIILNDLTGVEFLDIRHRIMKSDGADSIESIIGKGKTIITVVSGELNYFVTSDNSRYFVGSSLPSGYVVERISPSTVDFSMSGEIVSLNI
jgi:hypothetical protein